jgi:hypothetical protein
MTDPHATLVALSFDAVDPLRLAEFWAAVLRWQVGRLGADGSAELLPTDGAALRIVFRPTEVPKGPEHDPIHFDITTSSWDDQRETSALVVALGGSHLDVGQSPDELHIVMADPEGNAMCLIEPVNNFLRGNGRLGSITCDGSPAEGYFWRDALGWPMVWDEGDETAIKSPVGTPFMITWGGPEPDQGGRNRLYLEIAPADGVSPAAELGRLVGLGARPDHERDDMLLDPDGYRFRLIERR